MQSCSSPKIDLSLLSSMLSEMDSKDFPDLYPTSLASPKISNVIDIKASEIIEEKLIPKKPISTHKAKRFRKTHKITACKHHNKKHYARGMCNSCYHRHGRETYAWLCEHTKRKLYAKGMCEPCYNKQHVETGTKIKISKESVDNCETADVYSI